MKNTWFLFLVSLFILSCGSGERVSKEVFEEVNRSMEIKKLNESDIIQEATNWGNEISLKAQQELMGALQLAIEKNGVSGAIDFCNVNALPILSELSQEYGVEIRRSSKKFRNPNNKPTIEEERILEAYAYNSEKGLKSESNIQKIDNEEVLLYTKAILIPGELCLNCHGDPQKDILPETASNLNKLYPQDNATGHRIGDLRGMWSILIPKKEIIKRMD